LNFFFQLKKVQLKKKKSILAIQMGCRQLTYYSETADNKGIHTTLKIIWKNCTGHYTYDIHGNVDTLLQDNQQLSLISTALQPQRFKKIIYDYDLISGNVNLGVPTFDRTKKLRHRSPINLNFNHEETRKKVLQQRV